MVSLKIFALKLMGPVQISVPLCQFLCRDKDYLRGFCKRTNRKKNIKLVQWPLRTYTKQPINVNMAER